MMNQWKRWIKVLQEQIFKISPQMPYDQLEKLRNRLVDIYKTYKEPELDKDGKLINKRVKRLATKLNEGDADEIDISAVEDQEMMDELRDQMDLPEGTLVTNLFIPLMVVCSKMDLIEHGDKELKAILEQNLDFIQYVLREQALQYGASLAFSSSNSNSNIQQIYEYFLHRVYDTDFAHASNTADKEALFVPSGFDSPDLIKTIELRKYLLIHQ